ncbi:hypothetical protein [Trebonia kvetii]|nr:hypothetical protein [Trebonia kvetii]
MRAAGQRHDPGGRAGNRGEQQAGYYRGGVPGLRQMNLEQQV